MSKGHPLPLDNTGSPRHPWLTDSLLIMSAPLEGIRVLDFTRVLSGPIVGRLLSDLGADVIKIEPPEGDLTRYAYPRIGSMSLYYAQQNCGKRNVSLNLGHPDGARIARDLCDHADVILENFRPGVLHKYAIDYASVAATNPGAVYASISGYGQTGVWANRRAYAVVVHAEAGLIDAGVRMRSDAQGSPSPPTQAGMSHADVYAGLAACNGVLAALFARERNGGRGDHIDVAMAEAMLFVQDFAHWDYAPTDAHDPDRWPTLAPAYSPIVTTKDGHNVVIAGDPAGIGVFEVYAHAMQRTDLIVDARFARLTERRAHREDLLAIVHAWAMTFDVEPFLETLSASGFASGVVRSVGDLIDTEWAKDREVLVAIPNQAAGAGSETTPVIQSPFRFANATVGVHGEPAFRGEHNAEILHELLGCDSAAVEELIANGALSQRLPKP